MRDLNLAPLGAEGSEDLLLYHVAQKIDLIGNRPKLVLTYHIIILMDLFELYMMLDMTLCADLYNPYYYSFYLGPFSFENWTFSVNIKG